MKSGKAYILLVVAGALLIGFYMALSEFKPVDQGRTKMTARYGSIHSAENTQAVNESRLVTADSLRIPTMQMRVKTLRQQCRHLQSHGLDFGQIPRSHLDHIIVNDKFKLLYCYVPKVACTNLKRIFLLLTGQMNQTEPLKLKSVDVHGKLDAHLQYLDDMPVDQIVYRLQNYKKIMFVREPLERLLSAFRNKLLQKGNEYFKDRFGRKIIKNFRENPSERSLKKGDDTTFPEFVQYLLHPKTIEAGYNEHWATFTDLCHPCHIQYDFIGKYESIDEDVNLLLEDIGVSDIIKFPERGDTYKTLKTEDMLYKFYKDLRPEEIKNLMLMYEDDFKNFGYKPPESLRKLTDDTSV